MNQKTEGFKLWHYLVFTAGLAVIFLLCICAGSVYVPPGDTLATLFGALVPGAATQSAGGTAGPIILSVRLPRVLCVALVGAALALCGGAMQGLLRNPLADGSTLGVSSGASLGAVLSIAFGSILPGAFGQFIGQSTMLMAMLFAFLSLLLILSLAHKLDYSLATNTIILIGVIFSMFANSVVSLVVTFAGDRVKTIVFWTMGSLAGSSYTNVLTMLAALLVCGTVLLLHARELNAFSIGEDNARHVGINVRRVKLVVMVSVAALIGVAVSIGGTIGFVGLVTPHILRMVTCPNHKRLLPACLFGGAGFLMLTDLVARVLLRPRELPIGVVTSMIGAVVFIYIFYSTRKTQREG